ncbi:MAG TPA: hypothetical protein VHM02_08165, partial [Thermoanaerobaculia bacterium]|nr:hypothetical protein [Thermoanaerobaculia bacterium]
HSANRLESGCQGKWSESEIATTEVGTEEVMRVLAWEGKDLTDLGDALHGCWLDVDSIEQKDCTARIRITERASRRARERDFTRRLVIGPIESMRIDDSERVGYYDFEAFEFDASSRLLRVKCNIPVTLEFVTLELPLVIDVQ